MFLILCVLDSIDTINYIIQSLFPINRHNEPINSSQLNPNLSPLFCQKNPEFFVSQELPLVTIGFLPIVRISYLFMFVPVLHLPINRFSVCESLRTHFYGWGCLLLSNNSAVSFHCNLLYGIESCIDCKIELQWTSIL